MGFRHTTPGFDHRLSYKVCGQTRTQSLFMSLGERESRLDSIEARGVAWERAKKIRDCQISYARAVQFAMEPCSSYVHKNGTEL